MELRVPTPQWMVWPVLLRAPGLGSGVGLVLTQSFLKYSRSHEKIAITVLTSDGGKTVNGVFAVPQ